MTTQIYEVVQIPTILKTSHFVIASSIEEVREWALANVDTSTRWVVKLDGKNIGEAIVIKGYKYDCEATTHGRKVKEYVFNKSALREKVFSTKEEAIFDYERHLDAANARLSEIENKLNELKAAMQCEIDCEVIGDTHGIDDHYMYIRVSEGGYNYYRKIY